MHVRRAHSRLLCLRLLARLIDMHRYFQRFATAAKSCAAHGSGAKIIEAGRHTHVGVGDTDAIRRIETDPAKVFDMSFRPGMTGILQSDAVCPAEVTADISRRNAERSRRSHENVGDILADS